MHVFIDKNKNYDVGTRNTCQKCMSKSLEGEMFSFFVALGGMLKFICYELMLSRLCYKLYEIWMKTNLCIFQHTSHTPYLVDVDFQLCPQPEH